MKVSKLIHDLHEKVENLEKENVDLKFKLEDESESKWDRKVNDSVESVEVKILNERIDGYVKDVRELKKENIKLVAQLENDEHNVGHLDEKMKRLDYLENLSLEKDEPFHRVTTIDENMKRLAYLEKVFASNRYVFTDIPNTPENLKMVKMMKKYINKRRYNLRWRGQYLIEGEDWKKYTYGQPLSKSKCIRVYIDSKAYSIDTVEGFNMSEVKVIMDSLDKQMDVCSSFLLAYDRDDGDQDVADERNILNQAKELYKYFESMKLHLENSASTPIKDNVNIVIPKGDKQCHTK